MLRIHSWPQNFGTNALFVVIVVVDMGVFCVSYNVQVSLWTLLSQCLIFYVNLCGKLIYIAFISFKVRCHIEHFYLFLLIGNFMFSGFHKSCKIFQTFDHESIKEEITKFFQQIVFGCGCSYSMPVDKISDYSRFWPEVLIWAWNSFHLNECCHISQMVVLSVMTV